jgi:L-lactate dehydrogenase complex protein LldG
MNSREQILGKLRKSPRPFSDASFIIGRQPIVPVADLQPPSLQALFIEQAQKLDCTVQFCSEPAAALQYLFALIGTDKFVSSWDADTIPLLGLAKALTDAGVQIAAPDDPSVRIGITGADAALAGTGSLVLTSGPGKSRLVSLLPFIHIAIITAAQILPHLEAWVDQQRRIGLQHFRQTSNVLLISGPSRTADIAMELVLGAHGPAEVHILILP